MEQPAAYGLAPAGEGPPEPELQAPHLQAYLHAMRRSGLAEPAYYATLPQHLRQGAQVNVLYPLVDGVFAHVYTPPGGWVRLYRVIEPDYGQELEGALAAAERYLLERSAAGTGPGPEPAMLLREAAAAVCSSRPMARWEQFLGRKTPPPAAALQAPVLLYRLLRDKLGMGLLQPYLQDPHLEDISCSGVGSLYLVHRLFGRLEAPPGFAGIDALDRFVVGLAEKVGRPVNFRQPILDATLPDGSRINIVFGRQVSRRGSNFSVRRVAERPLSVLDLAGYGTVNCELLAYLSLVVGEGLNLFIAGEAAAGKTTLLGALTAFLPHDGRVVSVEDTPELRLAHGNWIAEVARPQSGSGGATVYELIKAALRQRPNAILVGEIRGEEGPLVFQAMQTGHACMSTIHAASVENVLQRLTGVPILVPRADLGNLHVVAVMSDVRLPSGRRGRRIISVGEVLGYEAAADRYAVREVFRWLPHEDRIAFAGSSGLLEGRVAHRRGLPPERAAAIYDELQRRTRFFQGLQARGVGDFYDVFEQLARAHQSGLFG